jgi:hypothetical protein
VYQAIRVDTAKTFAVKKFKVVSDITGIDQNKLKIIKVSVIYIRLIVVYLERNSKVQTIRSQEYNQVLWLWVVRSILLHLSGANAVKFGQHSLRLWVLWRKDYSILHKTNTRRASIPSWKKDKAFGSKMLKYLNR